MIPRRGGPTHKVLVAFVAILLTFLHHAATAAADADAADDNIDAQKRLRLRKNLATAITSTPTITTTYLVSFADKDIPPGKRCVALAQSMGGTILRIYEHVLNGCSLILPAAKAQVAYAALDNNPTVHAVEMNQEIFLTYEATTENIFHSTNFLNESAVAPSWGLDRINQCTLPLDNIVTKQNATGVKVFIIDTGIYSDHQEFANGVIGPGDCHLSLFSLENALTDVIGHG